MTLSMTMGALTDLRVASGLQETQQQSVSGFRATQNCRRSSMRARLCVSRLAVPQTLLASPRPFRRQSMSLSRSRPSHQDAAKLYRQGNTVRVAGQLDCRMEQQSM
jgi:hypothetical protein